MRKTQTNKKSCRQNGMFLMEVIIYSAIFVLLFFVLILFLVGAIRAWANAKTQRDLVVGAGYALNNISQAVKPSKNIYLPESILDVPLGRLSVSTEQTVPESRVNFYVDDDTLYEKRGDLDAFAITPENISVSQFKINTITSSSTPQGVQIILGLASKTIPPTSKTFYATLVWRGGY